MKAYTVTVELTNGIVFQTKVNKEEWDKFQAWLELDDMVEHYTVD